MTTLATRLKEIRLVEGLRVLQVLNKRNSKIIRKNRHGFRKYPMSKRLDKDNTVSDYIRRFEQVYPGYTCIVGKRKKRIGMKRQPAHGNTKLRNVR
jgi:hypothetical protein